MRKQAHYQYDALSRRLEASIENGAILFRLASLSHWERDFILNGGGAAASPTPGRFNRPYQRTSYCANNMILCIAERLFHMHGNLTEALGKGHKYAIALTCCEYLGRLVIFSVSEVRDLVFIDSKAAQVDYDGRIAGTGAVCTSRIYDVMHDVAEKVRGQGKDGLIYPSARHSEDIAIAFFGDKTGLVRASPYYGLDVRLKLIGERQRFDLDPVDLDPYEEKIHPTVGYFEFLDEKLFEDLRSKKLVYPEGLPSKGYIEFFRRIYKNYPVDAFVK